MLGHHSPEALLMWAASELKRQDAIEAVNSLMTGDTADSPALKALGEILRQEQTKFQRGSYEAQMLQNERADLDVHFLDSNVNDLGIRKNED